MSKLVVMTELKHKSVFERKYLGAGGVVEESTEPYSPKNEVRPQTYDEILAEYRKYVGDPSAEFSPEILAELKKLGKI